MASISKAQQFRQVKSEIQKNKDFLLIGIDVSKKSSIAYFYNQEKEIPLKKYVVEHNLTGFQDFSRKISEINNINGFKKTIIGVEPTANYHKPLSEFLKQEGHFMVYVSSVAAKNNRITLNNGRWGKNDPRDAYNVADLVRQGKILFYRDEISASTNIRKYLLLRQRLVQDKTSLKVRIQNNIWACHFPELCNIYQNADDPDVLLMLEHCPSSDHVRKIGFDVFMNLFPESKSIRTKRYIRLRQVWESANTSIGFPIPSSTALEAKIIARDIQRTKKDIEEIDKILFQYCMEKDSFRNLLTIPGFGVFTTSVFKSIIGNISDFAHHRQITKLAGLDIETMSSGTFQGKEKISKKGNSLLRCAIYYATNIAVSKNRQIKEIFQQKLKEHNNSKEAKAKLKIKFADKFIRAAFVMLKNNEPFNINLFTIPVDDPVLQNVRA